MDEGRWRDEAWLTGVHRWIDEQLARLGSTRTGEATQSHVTPWSTVIKVPTSQGDLWFKANDPSLSHEGGVVALVAETRPDLTPPLVALDAERGWLLMGDAGEWFRDVSPRDENLDRWLEVLPRYAAAQIALETRVDDLLALGVPDHRLPTLAAGYAALMDEIDAEPRFRAALPRVEELAGQLASYGIAETLNHDDLHDGQVFLKDGRHLVMDWGDACISHPFFTLSVTLEGVLAWGLDDVENSVDTTPFRDAYLAPYRERYDGDLDAACALAIRLGWACRAVNGHVPGEDAATAARLGMFLDGIPVT